MEPLFEKKTSFKDIQGILFYDKKWLLTYDKNYGFICDIVLFK